MDQQDRQERPSPEDLLEAIKQEESQLQSGRLKIFLGMAAGVGKTYAMLEEAQKLNKSGVDLVVGIVNTHGRIETARLLEGLRIIPEKTIYYKDKEFKELDIDAILKLQPDIVLVDELAHHNTPGSQHTKRWQDVIELLDSGINVYTTLNVQHIESLNDIVKGITDISVRETVPDLMIERASSIQLVDITPDELLERLREGKVYLGEQSQVAIDHFFQKDRLTALREIVLRYAADKVDFDLRKMIIVKEGRIEWRPREKLLVAINHSPHSQKLIRMTRRLSSNLDAPWIAVHVDNGRYLSDKEAEQLTKNINLARDLGAEVITVIDPSVADAIERIASQRGITQIIIGRKPRNRFLAIFKRETNLDRLISKCKDIDIHVIRQETYSISRRKNIPMFAFHNYLLAALYVSVLGVVCGFILSYLDYEVIGIIFLLGIFTLGLFFSKGPIIFASIISALIWDFFFVPPSGKFIISTKEDIAIMIIYILTGLTVGILVDRARGQKGLLVKSEKTTASLYEIVRQLSSNRSTEEILQHIKDHLGKLLNGTVEFVIKRMDGGIVFDGSSKLLADEKERNTAIWSYENGKEAGWSTETLPSAQNLYLPLKADNEVIGLLIFRPDTTKSLDIEEVNFLHTVRQEISNYFVKSFSLEKAREQEYLRKVEQIYNTILNRFSLVFEMSILATRNAIKKLKRKLSKKEHYPEMDDIEASFDIFIKIMNNISAMAQLSETMIPLKKSKHAIGEMIDECCEEMKDILKEHKIEKLIEENLPQINIDFHLMKILLQNLLLNAVEHSKTGTTIKIEAHKANGYILLSVSDEGKGIPEDQLEAIFEKFYRPPEETTPGIGLGLAISKTIAEVHHGTLKAENLPERGARLTLTLPIKEII